MLAFVQRPTLCRVQRRTAVVDGERLGSSPSSTGELDPNLPAGALQSGPTASHHFSCSASTSQANVALPLCLIPTGGGRLRPALGRSVARARCIAGTAGQSRGDRGDHGSVAEGRRSEPAFRGDPARTTHGLRGGVTGAAWGLCSQPPVGPATAAGIASARKSYTRRTSRLPRISRCTASQQGSGGICSCGSTSCTPGHWSML